MANWRQFIIEIFSFTSITLDFGSSAGVPAARRVVACQQQWKEEEEEVINLFSRTRRIGKRETTQHVFHQYGKCTASYLNRFMRSAIYPHTYQYMKNGSPFRSLSRLSAYSNSLHLSFRIFDQKTIIFFDCSINSHFLLRLPEISARKKKASYSFSYSTVSVRVGLKWITIQ